jgi:hypothetical protein
VGNNRLYQGPFHLSKRQFFSRGFFEITITRLLTKSDTRSTTEMLQMGRKDD